ncbi:MAG: hypothetical protein J5585_02860 [Clostridia bacterium]|nr:hypothetical protein [Clostridia bacterium]
MKNDKLNRAFDEVDAGYVSKTEKAPKSGRALRLTVIAAALALLIAAISVVSVMSMRSAPSQPDDTDTVKVSDTKKNEPDTTVEPFNGQTGNYSGAKFVSLANTSATAKAVFAGSYISYRNEYRSKGAKLVNFFDKLTQKLIDGEESAVVSPVNVYMALALLAECTDGSSRRQILDVIGVDSIEELRDQTKLIWLYNSRDDEYGRSMLANSIWLTSGLPVKNKCTDILKNDHYASSFTGDFADNNYKNALKQWLSDQTNGLLDQCINELVIPDETLVVLASTLYYKAKWADKYWYTEDGVFEGKNGDTNCVFNKKTTRSYVYDGAGFNAYCERLSDDNYMWFFLPDDGRTVSDVLSRDLVSYINNNNSGVYYEVTIRMPDFDVDYNEQIIQKISELGIVDCMGPQADFTALTDDPLYLTSVVHAARFKADKEGVEGAAFTVELLSGAIPTEPPKYDFTLDRPFVFMVENAGVPLFIGCVNDV